MIPRTLTIDADLKFSAAIQIAREGAAGLVDRADAPGRLADINTARTDLRVVLKGQRALRSVDISDIEITARIQDGIVFHSHKRRAGSADGKVRICLGDDGAVGHDDG